MLLKSKRNTLSLSGNPGEHLPSLFDLASTIMTQLVNLLNIYNVPFILHILHLMITQCAKDNTNGMDQN